MNRYVPIYLRNELSRRGVYITSLGCLVFYIYGV